MNPNINTNPPEQTGATKEITMTRNTDLNQDPFAADEARMEAAMKRQDARFVRAVDPEDCSREAANLEQEAAQLERVAGGAS